MSVESQSQDNPTQSILKIYNLTITKILIDSLKQIEY
jgi:S-adenosylmethionine synthetase